MPKTSNFKFVLFCWMVDGTDAHRGGGGRGEGGETAPPATKPKIGEPDGNFLLKPLTPRGFWQKFELPPWIFNRVHLYGWRRQKPSNFWRQHVCCLKDFCKITSFSIFNRTSNPMLNVDRLIKLSFGWIGFVKILPKITTFWIVNKFW